MKKALLILVVIAVLGAIGANPRYLEELRLGGGFGDTQDGGADFEKDGTIRTDGTVLPAAVDLPDGTETLLFGTDDDIRVGYDEVGEDRLEWSDGVNLLMSLSDTGTAGDLQVTGGIRSALGLDTLAAGTWTLGSTTPSTVRFDAGSGGIFDWRTNAVSRMELTETQLHPATDKALTLGSASTRWGTIWGDNGEFSGDLNLTNSTDPTITATVAGQDLVLTTASGDIFLDDNVGIGTNAPTQTFDLRGRYYQRPLVNEAIVFGITDSGSTNKFRIDLDGSDASMFLRNSDNVYTIILDSDGNSYINGGNFGIGLANPTEQLVVKGTSSNISGIGRYNVRIDDDAALAAGTGGGVMFGATYTSGGSITEMAGIWSEKSNATTGNFDGELHLGTRNTASGFRDHFVIDTDGLVTVKNDLVFSNATDPTITASAAGQDLVLRTTSGQVVIDSNLKIYEQIRLEETETVDDGSPDITGVNLLIFDPTSNLTVTNFDGGTQGGEVLRVVNIDAVNTVTLTQTANIRVLGGTTLVLGQFEGATFVKVTIDSVFTWCQVG